MQGFQSTIDNINPDHWAYVNPLLFARRLNRILKKPEIQQAYHNASAAIAAIDSRDVVSCGLNY